MRQRIRKSIAYEDLLAQHKSTFSPVALGLLNNPRRSGIQAQAWFLHNTPPLIKNRLREVHRLAQNHRPNEIWNCSSKAHRPLRRKSLFQKMARFLKIPKGREWRSVQSMNLKVAKTKCNLGITGALKGNWKYPEQQITQMGQLGSDPFPAWRPGQVTAHSVPPVQSGTQSRRIC